MPLKRKIFLYLLNLIRGRKENGNDSDGKSDRTPVEERLAGRSRLSAWFEENLDFLREIM